MAVKKVKQYTVFLPNKPGALSDFIKLFAEEGINIIGIASEIHDESGIIRIAVDSEKKLSYILTRAGFTTLETTIISVELEDKPGELLKLTKLLAESNLNITTVYGTAFGGKTSRVLLNVSDPEIAIEILSRHYN